ncbi:2491_t:CDS:2, partial [Racocetra fulgida]
DANYIAQTVAQAVTAVFSKGKGRARSPSFSSSYSSGATSSEDESEVEDKLVKRRRGEDVLKILIDEQSQSQDVRQKLISAITKKLPGYHHHSDVIEKILNQHYKTQRRTATINVDPKLKAYNRAKMKKNSKVNE